MDPFSVTIGSLSILDNCLKCFQQLRKKYNDYQQAEYEISEALLKLKVLWIQTEVQLTVIKDLWHTLPPDHQQTQSSLLCILDTKLNEVCCLLDSIIGIQTVSPGPRVVISKKGHLSRFKYALTKKQELNDAVKDFIEWHDLFDKTWRLFARLPGDDLDRALLLHPKTDAIQSLTSLRKSFKDLESVDDTESRAISSYDFLEARKSVATSSILTAQFEDRPACAIVDTMFTNPKLDSAGTTRSVKALAKALSRSEFTTFGLLRCCGVINKTTKYEFVFEVPPTLARSPQGLRALLQDSPPSLNTKLNIAKQLANSIFHLHAIGFVHKNIRPDSVLIFQQSGGDDLAFLFGFENYRMAQDETYYTADERPERELYRHPSRQGSNIQRKYTMQHDIYSLGICLLEIGMWKSLVATSPTTEVFDFDIDPAVQSPSKRANVIKKKLLVMVDEQLPPFVGMKYKSVVERCLTWLDDEGAGDKEGVKVDVGLQFIDDVLQPLREIIV